MVSFTSADRLPICERRYVTLAGLPDQDDGAEQYQHRRSENS